MRVGLLGRRKHSITLIDKIAYMEINNKNVYEVIQSAMTKLKELENIDRRMTIDYCRTLNWSEEAIDFGIANGMVLPKTKD